MRMDFDADEPPAKERFDQLGDHAEDALLIEELEAEWSELSRDCDGEPL